MTRHTRFEMAGGVCVLLLSSFAALAQSQPPTVCATVANMPGDHWTLNNNPAVTLTLSLSGTVILGSATPAAVGSCPANTPFSATGKMNADGTFSVTATVDHPTPACVNYVVTGTTILPDCNTAEISWFNVDGSGSGTGLLQHRIYLPTGESTPTFLGWDGTNNNGPHGLWQMTVTPGYNFGGRQVIESNTPGMQATDTCYEPGDITTPITGVTSGTWTIASVTNSYGPDFVGYGATEVLYYRRRNRAPCSANVYQTMSVITSSGPSAYNTNYVLSATIGPTTVGSAKDHIGEAHVYGVAQGALRSIGVVDSLLLQSN